MIHMMPHCIPSAIKYGGRRPTLSIITAHKAEKAAVTTLRVSRLTTRENLRLDDADQEGVIETGQCEEI